MDDFQVWYGSLIRPSDPLCQKHDMGPYLQPFLQVGAPASAREVHTSPGDAKDLHWSETLLIVFYEEHFLWTTCIIVLSSKMFATTTCLHRYDMGSRVGVWPADSFDCKLILGSFGPSWGQAFTSVLNLNARLFAGATKCLQKHEMGAWVGGLFWSNDIFKRQLIGLTSCKKTKLTSFLYINFISI